jgi:hypothetical protein
VSGWLLSARTRPFGWLLMHACASVLSCCLYWLAAQCPARNFDSARVLAEDVCDVAVGDLCLRSTFLVVTALEDGAAARWP